MQGSPYSENQRQQQYVNFQEMGQQVPQYAHLHSGQPGLTHSSPIEERKALIMAKLQEERELRRQYVAEGRGNEFQVQSLPSGSLRQTHQSEGETTMSPPSHGQSARFGDP